MPQINAYQDSTKREKDDFYPTPKGIAEILIRRIIRDTRYNDEYKLREAMDVGCGTGIWGEALYHINPGVIINGYDKVNRLSQEGTVYQNFHHIDVTDIVDKDFDYSEYAWNSVATKNKQAGFLPEYDLVVGNPPFSLAREFVIHGLSLLRYAGYMAYLLPLEFLGGQQRHREFFNNPEYNPITVYVFDGRIDFTGKKSPHSLQMLVVWRKGRRCDYISHWTQLETIALPKNHDKFSWEA